MTFEHIGTFLAFYGAILSTILMFREIIKERRRITIILEYVAWYERAQIVIVNSGHRPITISEISMRKLSSNGEDNFGEPIPKNTLFDLEKIEEPLPQIIKDGESIILPLSQTISEHLLENNFNVKIFVYDVEGHEFMNFKKRLNNTKWGQYSDI